MGFTQSIATCFHKYVTFKGVASRSEFWWFTLFTVLISFLAGLLIGVEETGTPVPSNGSAVVINILLFFIITIPHCAVTVRRFHDVNKSGWWLLCWYLFDIWLLFNEELILNEEFISDNLLFFLVLGIYILIITFFSCKQTHPDSKYRNM